MHRISVMNFSAAKLRNMILRHGAVRFLPMRSLSRRCKMRLRQHPGNLQPGQPDCRMRPGVPGLCRFQHHVGRGGVCDETTERFFGYYLHAVYRGKQFLLGSSVGNTGSDLSVLPEQPDRIGADQRPAPAVGGLCPPGRGAVILYGRGL